MPAYYNEIDGYCCAWLSNLMDAGLITPGKIDDRPIQELSPDDLTGYERAHFFAGIGGWDIALNMAGWGALPVWSGSCPCQPFSAAGAGKAADDERHLWPAWFSLIAECRPPIVFGEQVEAAIGWGWLDAVFSDLEGEGYACGAAVLPACSVGAPHIRQRLWFVADAEIGRGGAFNWKSSAGTRSQEPLGGHGVSGELGNTSRERFQERERDGRIQRKAMGPFEGQAALGGGDACGMVDTTSEQVGLPGRAWQPRISPWSDAEFIPCTDGKARPVEPLAQSMADGLPESMGRLRADQIAEVEREILNAAHSDSNGREAVHDLWLALWQEAFRQRASGRPNGVHEPRFLLAFMRQLSEQGWTFAKSVSRASAKTAQAGLRGVRIAQATACPSCGRGLDEQRPGECPNTLHLLPSILARHAQAAWAETFDAHARATFPLAHGIPGRVGRLRAYGNAIVPQTAAAFIGAFLTVK